MGKASTYGDASSSPQTCCTICRTVFEVSPELLSSADTRVRCGECLSIFDALANLRSGGAEDGAPGDVGRDDAADDGAGADGTGVGGASDTDGRGGGGDELVRDLDDETGALDITYSDFDLFSGDAELPEIAYLDETADTTDFEVDGADAEEDETFGGTLFVGDETLERTSPGEPDDEERDGVRTVASAAVDVDEDPDFVDDDTVEPPVFRYRDREAEAEAEVQDAAVVVPDDLATGGASATASLAATDAIGNDASHGPSGTAPAGGGWGLRVSVVLALAVLLGGLYAYRVRDSLHNDPLMRPVLVAGCRVIGCTVPSRVDLASLKLLDKRVFTHPSEADALVIHVAFRNAAAFDQRYPVLVVRLRDRVGRRVAERDFEPADYLDEWQAGDTLEAGRRLDISLEVSDPGDGADSYEFEFREAAD